MRYLIHDPKRVTFGAADTAPLYIRLPLDTDRHQLSYVYEAGAAGNLKLEVAIVETVGPNHSIPEPADIPAVDWFAAATLTSPVNASGLQVFVLSGRYVKLSPPAAKFGGVVTVTYQPLPPTSA